MIIHNQRHHMRAMVLEKTGTNLILKNMAIPQPSDMQVLLAVHACGICHTDLHILDGELDQPKLPLILGHQVVGEVIQSGSEARIFKIGQRVGVPWLGSTDGTCSYCRKGQENLCDNPVFTGYTRDGGFAEYCVADEQFCFPLPVGYADDQAAPLLCAGLIGYRTYRMTGDNVGTLGIFGFGAAAHIVTQVARFEGRRVFAFTRRGDEAAQDFALRLGAEWVGDSSQTPPEKLDAVMIFAPVGSLVVDALRLLKKGGVVVCGGIHMTQIPSFSYDLLWEERQIRSVANLTRKDGDEFFAIAPKIPIQTEVTSFSLEQTNDALQLLRNGLITGAAVIHVR